MSNHPIPRSNAPSYPPCRVALSLVLLCIITATLADTPTALQVSQVTAKGTDLVAYVRVQDESGRPVSGIAAGQVQATVGAEAARIANFKPFAETNEGVTYLFLVDESQSLTGPRFEQLRAALRAWVEALTPADRAGLIAFGSAVRTLVAPTADHAALNAAISALTNRDRQTRLHGALIQTLDLAQRQAAGLPDRRAIVLFSDGLDDAPGDVQSEDVLARLTDHAVPIYAVAFPNRRERARREAGLDALGLFARRSGGAVATATNTDPGPLLTGLRENIRSVYRAALECPGCRTDGNRYRVQVTLTAGGLTLADGRDVRLYPVAAAVAPPAPAAPPAPVPAVTPPAPATATPTTPGFTWVSATAAGAGLLALVLAVIWYRRRRATTVPAAPNAPAAPETAPFTLEPVALPMPIVALSAPEPPASLPLTTPQRKGPEMNLTFRNGPRRGQTVRLVPAPAILLGRDPTCTLALSGDDRISGRHARIRVEDRTVLLDDLDSTNGTALNGVVIRAATPLRDGDLIRLGGIELRVGLPTAALAAEAP